MSRTPKKNPAAVALGRLGGSVTSPEKAASSRANGALGGRPRKPVADLGPVLDVLVLVHGVISRGADFQLGPKGKHHGLDRRIADVIADLRATTGDQDHGK